MPWLDRWHSGYVDCLEIDSRSQFPCWSAWDESKWLAFHLCLLHWYWSCSRWRSLCCWGVACEIREDGAAVEVSEW